MSRTPREHLEKVSFNSTIRNIMMSISGMEQLSLLPRGKGAYGVVFLATDLVTNEQVAIKRVEIVESHKTYLKRVLRELIFLRTFDHENVIGMKRIMKPKHKRDPFLYVVTELMATDLTYIIRSSQDLTEDHVKLFLYQLLRGVKYLHSINCVHRDLKPKNLLVSGNCELKICDFGLARLDLKGVPAETCNMTDYVATRWYRAPEVILGHTRYTKKMDMWAVGCILAELLGRKPLFPGKTSKHQLELVSKYLGTKEISSLGDKIPKTSVREFVKSIPPQDPIPWEIVYPFASKKACDLLEKLLQFHPEKRISVDEALNHPYMASLKEDDIPVCKLQRSQLLDDWGFELRNDCQTVDYLRRIDKEIKLHSEADKLDNDMEFSDSMEMECSSETYEEKALPDCGRSDSLNKKLWFQMEMSQRKEKPRKKRSFSQVIHSLATKIIPYASK